MQKNGVTIYCDGGSRGNPGPAAAAFVVMRKGKLIDKGSEFLGAKTNNVAEYNSVILGLNWLVNNMTEKGKIMFVLDSQLVTKQLNGEYKVKNENLRPLILRARTLEKKFGGEVVYRWSSRVNNKIADRLVNEELDKSS